MSTIINTNIEEVSQNYFFYNKHESLQIKNNYVYTYGSDGRVYGLHINDVSNIIKHHGIPVDE